MHNRIKGYHDKVYTIGNENYDQYAQHMSSISDKIISKFMLRKNTHFML